MKVGIFAMMMNRIIVITQYKNSHFGGCLYKDKILKIVEENKSGLMEYFGLMILGYMFSHSIFNTDEPRNILMKAIKEKDYKGLSELVGGDVESTKKAVDAINELLAKQAEEHGINVDELLNNLK